MKDSSNTPRSGSVFLVKGQDAEGAAQYAYILIPPEKFMEVRNLGAAEVDITEYGEILYSGSGENPPEEVKKEMRERYGAEENFEEEFLKEFEKVTKNMILDNDPNN